MILDMEYYYLWKVYCLFYYGDCVILVYLRG